MVVRFVSIFIALLTLCTMGTVQRVYAEESVTFSLFSRQWPPFEMMDDTIPFGAALDLFHEIMPPGLKRKVIALPGARTVLHPMTGPVYTRLESKKWMGKTYSYWWSDVVLSLNTVLMSPKDNPREYVGDASLKGLTIGCIRNYTYPSVEPLFESGEAVRYDVNSDLVLLRMVKAGRVDAVVFDAISADWIIRNTPDLKQEEFHIARQPLDTADLQFAFNFIPGFDKWLPEINERIRRKRADGTIQRIMDRYK